MGIVRSAKPHDLSRIRLPSRNNSADTLSSSCPVHPFFLPCVPLGVLPNVTERGVIRSWARACTKPTEIDSARPSKCEMRNVYRRSINDRHGVIYSRVPKYGVTVHCARVRAVTATYCCRGRLTTQNILLPAEGVLHSTYWEYGAVRVIIWTDSFVGENAVQPAEPLCFMSIATCSYRRALRAATCCAVALHDRSAFLS